MPIEPMTLTELEQYTGTGERPADFESFWAKQRDTLGKMTVPCQTEKASFELDGLECNDLTFGSFDASRIHCKMVRPAGRSNLPILFYFHGYKSCSMEWWHKAFWAERGYCVVAMDVRGQAGPSQDMAKGFGCTCIGHLASGIEGDREDMTFVKVFKDILCLVSLVRGFDFVDKDDLSVYGGSQGGALALFTAAMFPQVRKAAILYPFLSDFRRAYALDPRGSAYEELFYIFRFSDPLHQRVEEYFHKLDYIDVKNFAPMVHAEVLMASGLKDETCPASGHFAVFNNLVCKKRMMVYPDFGHEDFLPGFTDECCQFFRR